MGAHFLLSAEPAFAETAASSANSGFAPRAGVSAKDRALLNALAAMQLRYGQAEEALGLLQLTHRFWPQDIQTLRLLVQAFTLIEDWESAALMQSMLDRELSPARRSALDHVRAAFILLGLGKLGEARQALMAALPGFGAGMRS